VCSRRDQAKRVKRFLQSHLAIRVLLPPQCGIESVHAYLFALIPGKPKPFSFRFRRPKQNVVTRIGFCFERCQNRSRRGALGANLAKVAAAIAGIVQKTGAIEGIHDRFDVNRVEMFNITKCAACRVGFTSHDQISFKFDADSVGGLKW
jgi:hypothetical protein